MFTFGGAVVPHGTIRVAGATFQKRAARIAERSLEWGLCPKLKEDTTMELRQFVSTVLQEICEGVKDAQREGVEAAQPNTGLAGIQDMVSKMMVQNVNFDVALTVEEASTDTKTKGGAMRIWVVHAGARASG